MNRKMKSSKIFLIAVAAILASTSFSLKGQVKITDGSVYTMDPNSLLELTSPNKGLLIPTMAINDVNLPAPLIAPVPAGMLVFSSGGEVNDGFYYWNSSSKWVRLIAGGEPVKSPNIVSKSANATLLKTENMVFATGNITLTFPSVTSSDDGLEFTIKNLGTYSELISLVGYDGATIDNNDTVTLSRWKARTFIAKSGNWFFKEREVMKDNYLDVGPFSSFNTIAGVVAFMNLHMDGPTVVQLGPGTFTIAATQTINLPYPVTFVGSSYGGTIIEAAAGVSGTPLFDCQSESYFKMIIFNAYSNAPGNDAIRCTGPDNTYHEIKDCSFDGFNKGIVCLNNNEIWVFETDFSNITGAGLEISAGSASGGSLKISESDFTQCGIGINMLSGVAETISVQNCSFYNTVSGTDIGIRYTPATFTAFISMFVSGNSWNDEGTFISGFDFSRSDGRDANVFISNNLGLENENPHAKISIANNVNTTTVTTAGTYYKANWAANTTTYTCKWTVGSDSPASGNRLTYQPNNARDGWAIITGNIKVNQTNRTITIGICKDGVATNQFGATDIRIVTANQPYQFSTVIYITDLVKNQYLELYCTSSNSGDLITFQDVQWFINTQ
jgi:hypothetical protein